MADLPEALDRELRAAGWKRQAACVYERRPTGIFALGAQFWVDDEIEVLISMRIPRVDMALVHLGEDEVHASVDRDPFDAVPPGEVAGLVRDLDAAAERMRRFADVDTFIEAIETDEDTRADAPIAVPVILAVAGRKREALERARKVPGDFADRLERWLAGERPPPPPGFEDVTISWADVARRAARSRATPRENRGQMSWRDLWRTGATLARGLRGELPELPDRDLPWEPVELHPGTADVLERAHERSEAQIIIAAYITVRVEPGAPGRLRVLVDGSEVGTVPGSGADDVPGKLERKRPGEPLTLAVQLPERS